MKGLMGKLIPFWAGLTSLSLMGLGPTNNTIGIDLNDVLIWIFRSFITLCIATIAYFLKGMIDDNREENRKRDERIDGCDDKYTNLIKVTAAHEVMYQIWLEDLVSGMPPENGMRKTDQVHRLISQLAESKKS